MHILILGGTGGIGSALIKAYLSQDAVNHIHATYHNSHPTIEYPQLTWHRTDVSKDSDVAKLSETVGQLDIVINTVGMLHNGDMMPEKTITQFDSDFFNQNIATNVLPTLLIAKHLSPKLKSKTLNYFVTVSAKIGSIEDNHLGGWISYRSSKAALNMALKTISIEWKNKKFNTCVFAFHPGTTDTNLSKPFQRNVPEGNLQTPEKVAAALINLLQRLNLKDNGKFFSYDGTEIPW
ncbi:short chain dehydrogenase [Photobacterium sp. GB-27]|uniref:SDR family NAD(P)-dependent oxidoreductase n=1 Tax=Photobacterium sp. GB-27 TaxID=2022109 RepID=UPI000D178B34|nr:SDR family NAD(P)-dependent oxidoreductase [Photobacterium sp. GB-27]PSV38243.1 short chain dehydrogenase [Photobacterium sp. GB-27]